MKKYVFYSLILVVALGGYWFYSNSSNASNGKVKVNIIGENSSTIQAMMRLEKEYEDLKPNVDLVFHANTFDDAFNKSNQDFANKTGLYDIIIQYNFSLASFVENKYVYTLDELNENISKSDLAFEKNILKNYWEELGYYFKDSKSNDKTTMKVGYPSAALTMVLMYNKKMFEDINNRKEFQKLYGKPLSVPNNWTDYYSVAEFFSGIKETKGVCMEGGTGGFLYFELMNFIGNMDGKLLESNRGWDSNLNTKITITSEENIKALEYYKSLRPFNQGGFSNVEQFEQMRIMKEGKTAMALVWSDMLYPSIKTAKGFDERFGFSAVPGNNSILGGGAFFVNKQTKKLKEVTEFINFIMQEETQTKLALNGYCSPLASVYKNKEVLQLPYGNALKESLERANITLVAGPDANIINEVITTYVQKCWNEDLTPSQALNQAHKEIESKRKEIFSNLN